MGSYHLSWINKVLPRLIGDRHERYAERYLQQRGLRLVSRNYFARCGEIDLIMKQQEVLVFVEVRYRKNATFGGAIASITPTKLKKIRKTALYYLQQQKLNSNLTPYRIDLIAIEDKTVHWLQAIE